MGDGVSVGKPNVDSASCGVPSYFFLNAAREATCWSIDCLGWAQAERPCCGVGKKWLVPAGDLWGRSFALKQLWQNKRVTSLAAH